MQPRARLELATSALEGRRAIHCANGVFRSRIVFVVGFKRQDRSRLNSLPLIVLRFIQFCCVTDLKPPTSMVAGLDTGYQ